MRSGGSEHGAITQTIDVMEADEQHFGRAIYVLLRCAGCGRGGLATVYDNGNQVAGLLKDFYPFALESARLPEQVPVGVVGEYREAELCASVKAWRGASALLRSALEKTLEENGYSKGSLHQRINEAAADGAITAARSQRAHDDVRTLGNDILHDEWRPVSEEEYETAHHYVLRVLEDLYDDRATVEKLLIEKGRLPA
jgi:hypothetical protein